MLVHTSLRCLVLRLTCNFSPENSCTKPAEICSCELLKKGCFSSSLAEGRSSGLLWKQDWRKSFPAQDKFSGIGGALFNTLNIACTYHIHHQIKRTLGSTRVKSISFKV